LGEALAVAGMPVVGLVDTRNAYGGLTDSAAGATALSTGVRTFNRAIAVAPECRTLLEQDPDLAERDPANCAPLPTLLERAEEIGKSTGLITTTAVTDATPASFVAHSPSRYLHRSIAPQLLASGVDVVLGGGREHFDGSEEDGAGDLLDAACAAADCPADAAELAAAASGEGRLIGLFAADDMPRAGSRTPDLPTMTRVALDRLSRNDEGFFLLVETEGTDSYQHDNDPLASIEAEIVELDRAIAVALDFADRVPGTLVVVTADHETGGLAITGEASSPERELHYTTGGHTHAMVPLFAAGPGAERLAGIRDNDEVGRILRELFIGW
ncbi:MAG: alkaline phosphatase, partial [Gemmatimonadota bacterium]